MSKIIHARVVEIIEQVFLEIKNYGHESPKKKLIAGIVLTGGGSQLKHLKQLVEYITGMDTRIGYPNEHLAGNSDPETTSPMYATAVGLVMDSLVHIHKHRKTTTKEVLVEEEVIEETTKVAGEHMNEEEKQVVNHKPRKNILEKWTEKFKEFLDNAE